ncbi:hypothetical protein DHEL01_v212883, partial [Diaporthe helianthi]
ASRTPSRALLCFHGTGSKGSIFNVQLARICYLLREEFEFIFVDGPLECGAGPGVLPMFAGQEPYYCWFGGDGTTIDESMMAINGAVSDAVQRWSATKQNRNAEIVGGLGFSEGALTLAMLLWEQQQGRLPWLPRLQFAVMSCCFFPNEASLWLNASAQSLGLSKAHIDVPTLHVHGNRDFCLGRARKLVRTHYKAQYATVMQVDAGHHLPTKKEEVQEVVKHILRLGQMTVDKPGPEAGATLGEVAESMTAGGPAQAIAASA